MLLTLFSQGKIHTSSLPDVVSGMHWIADADTPSAYRYGFVEAKDEMWVLSPKKGMQVQDEQGHVQESVILDTTQESLYSFTCAHERATCVLRVPTPGDKTYSIVGFGTDEVISIGTSADNTLCHPSRFVSAHHARIDYVRDTFSITDLGSDNATFVNGKALTPHASCTLAPSDVIEILGLRMVVGYRFLCFNNPSDSLVVTSNANFVFFEYPPAREPSVPDHEEEPQFFYPAPRFKREIEKVCFSVDGPPAPEKVDETSIAMKIGPSMVMALAAVFSAAMMVMRMQESSGSLLMAAPMLVMAVAMVSGSVLWPLLTKRSQKKKVARAEAKRRQMYATYLDAIRMRIRESIATQKQILEENRIDPNECMKRAFEHDPRLMDRTPSHSDFLDLRLGCATLSLEADIRYPDKHFSVEKDDLSEVVFQLAREPKEIPQAPLAINLIEHPIVGIAGDSGCAIPFLSGLITQIACLHSYEEVKIVFLCDSDQKDTWGWVYALPHVFSDDKSRRLCASSLEQASEIALSISPLIEERRSHASSSHTLASPHYVFISTSVYLSGKSELAQMVCASSTPGVSFIALAPTHKDLPKQCNSIIELSPSQALLRQKDETSGIPCLFVPDIFVDSLHATRLTQALNTVELDVASAQEVLPESLGFLEMYTASNLEQLNVREQWNSARASTTLACRVGQDVNGEPFYLNLHERTHGPHGLIAGTTGSGKSEFIITWILSMAISFSPLEVAFVLIDYKGGGLAGAFDNERVRLPHLAGTITNLDGAAIARSLVSIKSELKRRQALFNQAREVAQGDNVDIYKYLELFHAHKVDTPCPHLFIVADEFAELKQQEPEFMDELISAARIGRSLGVHLVLATQKPSGVVNDQIWSNSKFKICLKVADKQDSMEMIKRSDAAELTQAGRFYLLVGYNELFAQGQSAYSGVPYIPKEQYTPQTDDSVVLISDTGHALASAKLEEPHAFSQPLPQLVAVLRHLSEVAYTENISARPLWLDPLPAHLSVDDLIEKYSYTQPDPFDLNPIIGELDDPAHQSKRLLTLPLSQEGNAVVYGSADSGVETLITSLLYNLITTHDAAHFNAYIMDFGSESLSAFRNSPHVGEVICAGEDEKVSRLFDMLEAEMQTRRKTLASFGGSHKRYCQQKNDMPSILVVINALAIFNEIYDSFEQRLIALSRDGIRVGISVLVSASASIEVRMRLRTNFKLSLALSLADKNEYLNVFGSIRGVIPPKGYGRGLVKCGEDIFEFQTAQVLGKDEDEFGYIQAISEKGMLNDAPKARKVPVMPEILDFAALDVFHLAPQTFPIGIYDNDLSLAYFDFEDKALERVVFSKVKEGTNFIKSVTAYYQSRFAYDLVILDMAALFTPLPQKCLLETQESDEAWEFLRDLFIESKDSNKRPRIVFISGIAGFLLRSNPTDALSLKTYLKNLRPQDTLSVVLFDSANEASYTMDEWFKNQASSKDGIWIGEGLDSQNAIQVTYGLGERVDPSIKGSLGYVVWGGKIRKTNFLTEKTTNSRQGDQ